VFEDQRETEINYEGLRVKRGWRREEGGKGRGREREERREGECERERERGRVG